MRTIRSSSFLYGSALLGISVVLVKILGAVFKIPLAGILHETGMGYFTSAYTIYTAVYALAVSGLCTATARVTADCAARGYRLSPVFRASMILFCIIGISGSVLAVLCANLLAGLMGSPDTFYSILAVAPAILFCCVMAAFRGYYEGLSDMKPTAVTQVIEAAVKVLCGLTGAFLVMQYAKTAFLAGEPVFGTVWKTWEALEQNMLPFASAAAMAGVSLSTAGGCIYLFLHRKKRMVPRGNKPIKTRNVCTILLKTAAPVAVAAGLMQLCAMIDTLTIQMQLMIAEQMPGNMLAEKFGAYLAPSEELHTFLYGALMSCMTLFHLIPAFTAVFSKSALSCITRAFSGGNREEKNRAIRNLFFMTSLVSMPAVFGLCFLAKPLLTLLYPSLPGMVEACAPVLPVLAVSSLCMAFFVASQTVMQAVGKQQALLPVIAVGAVLKLVCNLWLVRLPHVHIMGAAVGTLACNFLMVWYGLLCVCRVTGGSYAFLREAKKPMICGFLCGICAFFAEKALTNASQNSIITFVSIACGAGVYGLSLLFLRVFRLPTVFFGRKRAEKSKNT